MINGAADTLNGRRFRRGELVRFVGPAYFLDDTSDRFGFSSSELRMNVRGTGPLVEGTVVLIVDDLSYRETECGTIETMQTDYSCIAAGRAYRIEHRALRPL